MNEHFTECHQRRLDLAFVVDGSDNIKHKVNFRRMLHFVKTLIASFDVRPRGVRVAVVVYSRRPHLLFNLGSYRRPRNMFRRIDRARYMGGSIKTGVALLFVRKKVFRVGSRPKVCVILTSGKSRDLVRGTKGPAKVLMGQGVDIIAIGVTRTAKHSQLKEMASSRGLVFNTHFKLLPGIARIVKKAICNGRCYALLLITSFCLYITMLVF